MYSTSFKIILNKYIGTIKEEIILPISKPNTPDFINGKPS